MNASTGVPAAWPGVADPYIARRETSHAGARLGDDPGHVAALAGRERRGEPGVQLARPDLCFPWVDPGRLDLHEDLSWPRLGHRHVLHVEHVDPAVLREPHRSHGIKASAC